MYSHIFKIDLEKNLRKYLQYMAHHFGGRLQIRRKIVFC